MWLSEKLSAAPADSVSAERGFVTIGGDSSGVFSCGESRELPVVSPGGYVWKPACADPVLVLQGGAGGEERCIIGKVQGMADSLADGEVCIFSRDSNAAIFLRNDGRIELNGQVYINGVRYPNT